MRPASTHPEPDAPRRAITITDAASAYVALAAGADALVFEAALPPGLMADLRARRPDLTLYAAHDGADDSGLDALIVQRPDGVLLRNARTGRDVAALGGRLAVCEAQAGLPDGVTVILAAIGHPLGVLDARSFAGASPRLAGLGLDGTAIPAGLRAPAALAQARSLVRLAASAAGVAAFDMLTAGEDCSPERLAAARQDGFEWVVVAASGSVAG
ncbi:aldolase [Methylobacterium sp. Leaf123]|uniref:aldolase n=1 Tax=Methylobacterium sp. Leaf123 TaxID=1736264 RepID=UPI0006FC1D8D|nr:aldolase [Methylobacterium sp. Leaf123]KQQ31247.1 aldolase [Methylobacterium sp. Leaf123]